MRKIRILLMVFVLVLPLSLSSFTTLDNSEAEIVTEETTETVETTPVEEEPSTDETVGTETDETTPGETDTPADVTDESGTIDEELENIAEENKDFLDSVIQTITDGALWANILMSITVLIGTIFVVKDKFGKIITVVTSALKVVADLINKKADSETVIGELQKTNTEVSAVINTELGHVRDELVPLLNGLKKQLDEKDINDSNKLDDLKKQLEVKDENDKALWTVLTIFMQNVKIPDSAKGEILNRMNGIKEFKGNISELVAEAQEAINATHEEKLALEEETPNLNAILEEVETEG